MKRNIQNFLGTFLFGVFTMGLMVGQTANISYEVRVNPTNGIYSSDGSSGSGSSCWELSDEEYTANVRIDNPTTGTNFCLTDPGAGASSNYGLGTVLRSSTNVATTNFTVVYDIFEDDGGARCTFDGGDDCRGVGSYTIGLINNYFPTSLNSYSNNTQNTVYNAGSSQHIIRIDNSWRYAGTANLITPTCTAQNIAYGTGGIWSWSVNLIAGVTYNFNTCSGASNDTYLRVYGPDGYSIVVSGDDNCGVLSNVTYTAPSSGTYYVEVSQFNRGPLSTAGTLTYSITSRVGQTLANPITVGTLSCTAYSNIQNNSTSSGFCNDYGQTSDDIYYSFTLANPATVNISHCGSGFDTYVWLLNSSGVLITSNDDNGVLCGGTEASLQVGLAAGTYYVVSEGWSTNAGNINTQISIQAANNPGAIAAPTSVCVGTATSITNVTAATGASAVDVPTYYYYYQRTSAPVVGWTMYDGPTTNLSSALPSAVINTPGTYILARNSAFDCYGQVSAPFINLTVDAASTLGTVSNAGPINFCDAGGNFTTAVTVSGQTGTIMWDWGSNNGVWNNNWIAGNTSGVCCFPKKTSNSDGNADRIRYRVTNGTCGAVTSGTILIQNRYNEAPTSLASSSSTYCANAAPATITLTATFPAVINMNGTVNFYSGSCGGTLVGSVTAGAGSTTAAVTIGAPGSTTTYFARYEPGAGTGCSNTACVQTTVTVNTLSIAPSSITGITTICNGGSTTLTQSGGTLGTGAVYNWYTVSCGGTLVGTGNSITVSPASNTTYFVRAQGTCNTTTCASTTVTVNSLSVAPTGITGTTTICGGGSTTLTVSGGSAGTGAVVEWFTGSCGGTAAGTGNSITVSPGSNTTYFVRYNGTCNTTACASVLVSLETVAPTISCPANISVNAAAGTCAATVTYTAPIGTDNCAGATTVRTSGLASGSSFPVGVNTIVYRVTDAAGNTATCSFTVTVVDNILPTISCPANISVNAAAGTCAATVTYTAPIGTDNCAGPTTTLTSGLASGSSFPVGVNTIVYRVTDAAGNTATCSFTVTVVDNILPTISCPANISVNAAAGTCAATVTYTAPIGTDNCAGPTTTLTSGLASGSSFPVGVTTNVFRVTDAAGNTATCSFTVTVVDNILPTITCPANISVNAAAGTCAATVTYTAPIGTDNCAGPTTTLTSGLASGSSFPVGVTTNVFRVTDAAGNTATCSFTVTVVDNILPTITCPANISVNAAAGTCAATVTYTAPIGTDNCAGPTTTLTSGLASGSSFPVGVTTNVFRVTDAAGNTATCSFTVTVVDNILPTISCPANISVNAAAGTCAATVTYTAPIGTDNCAGATTVRTSGLASGSSFPVGVNTIVYRVTDAAGNTATCSFTVTVTDNILPTITCPSNITVNNAAGFCNASVVTPAPTFGDNCAVAIVAWGMTGATTGTSPGVGINLVGTATFNVGVTNVGYGVVDASGNNAGCAFTVTVLDVELPTISCPANIVQSNTIGTCGKVVAYTTPSGSDNCPGSTITQIAGLASGATFPVGTTTNTFRVTDASGNSSTCSFTVTINDTELPTISCPANISVDAPAGFCSEMVIYTPPTGSDNCAGATTTQIAGLASGAAFPVGTTTNIFRVTDASGNSATCSFTVTVNDIEFPAIVCPSDIFTNATTGTCSAIVTYTVPVGIDNCPSAITTQIGGLPSGSSFPVGLTTNIFRVTDASGNSTTCSFDVNVFDAELPSIACPSNISVNAPLNSCAATVTYSAPLGTDNCIGATTAQIAGLPSGSTFPGGVTVNVFMVTDAAGNTASCSFTVTVNDIQAPTITCPTAVTLNNDPGLCSTTLTPACVSLNNFVSEFSPSHWFFDQINADGFLDLNNAPYSILMNGGDNQSGTNGFSNYSIPITCDGTISFDWNYSTTDTDPYYDRPQFSVDSGLTFTLLTGFDASVGGALNQSGTVTIPVLAGQGFVLDMFTIDNLFGSASVTITNFSGPSLVPGNFVELGTPVTNDNCIVNSVTSNAVSPLPVGTTNVVWTVTDWSGNSTTCTQVVTVHDNQAPTISCNAPIVVNNDLNTCGAIVTYSNASADNCPGQTIAQTAGLASGSLFPIGTTTNTFVVTDASGNTASCSFTVTVNDNQAPTISCNAPIVVNNDANTCGAVVTYSNSSSDNCAGQTISQTAGLASGSLFPIGTTTNTFVVTDASGNTASCSFTVTVNDNQAPTISCNAPIVVNNDLNTCGAIVTYSNASADNCPGQTIAQTAGLASGSLFPIGTTTNTFVVTDASGNTASCSFTVTVNDNQAPTISCNAPIVVSNDANTCGAIVTYANSSTDNCPGQTISQTAGLASGSLFPIGTTTNTFVVTDASGNTASCSFTVTVNDNQAPTISCNAPIVVNNDLNTCGAIVTYSNSSSDNCAGQTISQTAGLASGSLFPIGTTTNTFVVTDASGNTASCSFTVTVNDNQAPTISCNAPIVVNNDLNTCGAIVTYSNSSTDNCPGQTISQTAGLVSGSLFPIGTTTNTFVVTDASGNTASCSFTVTVNDNQAPTISCNAPIVVNNDLNTCGAIVTYSNSSTDNCPGQTISQTAGLASGSLFPIGTTTNTFVVTDASGNTASCSFTVTVNDNQAPTISCNAPIVVNNDLNTCGAIVTYSNASADNCPGQTIAQTAGLASGSLFPIGTTTNTFVVTDASGNTASCSFTVTVNDNQAPTISCNVPIVVNNDLNTCGAIVTYANSSSDNCAGQTISQTAGLASGSLFPIGTTTNTFVVTDASGNTASCSFTVTVNDNQAPTISCNVPIVVNNDLNTCGAIVTYANSSSDNCAGQTISQTAGLASGSLFPIGTTTNTFVVTDASGNTASCSFTVTVNDNQAPTISCNAPIVVSNDANTCGAVVTYSNSSADNCAGQTISQTTGLVSGSLFPIGTTTNTFVVTDASGNTASCSFTVTVNDNQAPTISCNAPIVVNNDLNTCGAIVTYSNSSADNCAGQTISQTTGLVSGSLFPIGTTTNTFVVTDASGNTASCSFTVTVNDNQAPTISCNAPIVVNNDLNTCGAIVTYSNSSADNCPGQTIAQTAGLASGSLFPIGTTTNTFVVTDASGNTASCSFTVTVNDNQAPTLSCNAPIVVNNDLNTCGAVVTYTNSSSDNCAGQTISQTAGLASGSLFPIGTTTNTFVVTDASGNTASCSFTVTVNDNQAPTISCNAPIVVNNDLNTCGAIVTYSNSSADNCAGQTISQTTGLVSGSLFPIGTTTNTFVVTDASGNTASCSFTVTVNDNQAPTISCNAPIVVSNDANTCGAVVTYSNSSADNCAGQTISQTAGLASGSLFPIGTTTNTFVVTDASGNTASCSFTVTVNDNQAPTISCNAPIVVNNDLNTCGAIVTYSNSSADNCAGQTISQTTGLVSGSLFPIGTTTNTFVVTDASGNTASCSFTVTVNDNQAPTISCNAPIVVNNDLNTCGAIVTYSNSSADNCPGQTIAQTAGLASGSLFPIGTTTNTFVVTDASGNTASCSFTVTVNDNQAPTLSCNAPIVVNNDLNTCGAVVTYTNSSSDNCAGQTISQTAGLASGSLFPIGTTTNTFVVTDASGNTASCSFTVTVNDNQAPTISCNAPIVVSNDANTCGAVVTYSNSSTDNCPGQTISQTAGLASGSLFPIGITTNTFVVTDASGNTASCSFTVTVNDNQAPTISCNAPIVVNNDLNTCGAVVTYSNSSTDNCAGQTISQTAGLVSGSLFPIGTTTNTFVVTDASGNTASCSFTVTVNDNQAPTISCNAPIVVNNDLNTCGAIVTYSNSSADNCPGQTISQTAGLASGSLFPIGTTTNTFVVTDASGNTASCSFTVTVNDNQAPTISCNAPIVVSNDANTCGAVVTYSNSSADNCAGQTISQTAGLASGSLFPIGTTTNTFVVTDASGNTASCSFTVTVNDNQAPTISCNAPIVVSNDANTCGAVVTYSNSSADNCAGQTISQTAGLASGSLFPIGTTTNTFVVTDASGNTASCSFTVTVNDNQAPTISCNAPIVVNNDLNTCGAIVTYSNSSADNCPGQTIAQTAGLVSGSLFPIGTTTNTFVVTDASGNTASCSFTVTVNDNQAPTISCNAPIVVNNDLNTCGAVITYTNSSSDNCAGQTISQTAGLVSGSLFPIGTTTNTFVVTDASGNTASCSFTVTVNDNQAPTISCNAPIVVSNDANTCGAVVTYSNSSADNCAGQTISQTAGLASGSLFPIGTTTNTFVVTDASGNTASCSFTVTVNDNQAPTISCNAPIVVSNDANTCGAVVTYSNSSADNCAGQTISQTAGLASGSLFPIGTTTNTFVVTDASGNTASCSFTVTVNDNQAPTISCNAPIVVNNDLNTCGAIVTYSNSSADNCPGQTIAQTAGLASGSLFPIGTTTNTFVVTDASGNTASCSFTVTVNDNQAPTLSCNAPIVVNNDLNTCGAVITYTNSSSDNCAGQTISQTAGLVSGSLFPIGTTTNTFVVTDASGNTASCSFTVTVNDNQAPTISCNAPIVVNNDLNTCGAIVTYSNSSADNCAGQTISQTAGLASGSLFPIGTTTNTFVVTDASGNTASCSFTVTVNDNQAPTISCNAPIVVNNDLNTCGAVITYTNSSSDNCAGQTISQTAGLVSGSLFPIGTTTNTFVVTDASGNTASCSFTVTVNDNQAPTISCNAPIVVNNDLNTCGAIVTYSNSSTDNCPGQTISQTAGLVSGSLFPIGTTTNTFVVTDASGNTASCSFTVTVNDNQAPTISCNAPIVVNNDANTCGAVVTYSNSSTDNCAGQTISQTTGLASGSLFPIGTTTNTFVVTDASGNTASCSFTVTVNDNQAPTISCNAPIIVNNDLNTCGAVVTYSNSSSDNCAGQTISQTAGLASGSLFPIGTTTNTFVVTDASGNTASCSFTVTVNDNQAPTISCNAPIVVNNDANTCGAVVTYSNSSSDNCAGQTISQTAGLVSGSLFPIGTTTNTFVVTDASGNTASCSFTVTVNDNQAPTISCNAPIVVSNDANTCGAVVTYSNSSSDNCAGQTIAQTAGLASGSLFPIGTTTNTFVVTDASGNTASCSFTVTVNDNQAPTISCNAPIVVNNDLNTCGAIVTYSNSSTDNCPGQTISQTAGLASGSLFPIGTTTNTFVVTDASGNTASCSFTVTVNDNQAPTISCNAPIVVSNDANTCGAVVTYSNSSSDNCAGQTIAQTAGLASGSLFPIGTTTNTFVVTDASGNTASCSFTVTVNDNQAPTISCNAPIVVNNDLNTCGAIVTYSNSSTDNCPGQTISQTTGLASGSLFPIGTTTNTFVVTDASGNTASCSFTVTVNDTPPVAICQNVTVSLDAFGNGSTSASLVNNGSTDACGIASLSLSQTTFNCSNVGTNNVVLTVTDVNGFTSTCSAIVTVNDVTPPTAICQTYTLQLDAFGNGSILPSDINNGSNDACGISTMTVAPSTFNITNVGANTVVLTLTDVNGNTSTCSTTVNVIDNNAPIALCQPVTVNLDSFGNGSITAAQVDNGSNDPSGIASLSVSPNTFNCSNVGPNTVTLLVTDVNGNTSTCTAIVTVQDLVPPVAICQNVIVSLDAFGNGSITPALVNNGSNDACGIQSLSLNQTSFTCANIGANTVVLTVTDVNGNTSTCSATVTVQDLIPPVAICQNVTVSLDAFGNGSTTAVLVNNGSNDACGIQSLSLNQTSFTCANVGANTVVLTVTDVNGNASTCSSIVTVQDLVPPVAICQTATVVLDAMGNGSLTAADIDNGSNDVCGIGSLSISPSTFDCSNVGTGTVVTLTATDVNGNSSTCSTTITVIDNIGPVAMCQDFDIILDASGHATITSADIDNGSNDACGILSLVVIPTTFDCSNIGANTVTMFVTDNNGNVAVCNSTGTVIDNTAPVAICQNYTTQLDAFGNASITAANVDNGSGDACGLASITVFPTTFNCSNVGNNIVTLTVTDINGNTATCTSTVTIVDNIAPVISALPAATTINCPSTPSFATPTASDNCIVQTFTFTDAVTSGACAGSYSVTRTWIATDGSLNTTTASQTIVVIDTDAPVIAALPSTTTINCSATPNFAVASATDACGSTFTLNFTDATTSGGCAGAYSITRTWTATDACGNSSSASQTINVIDTNAPVISALPANSTIDCSLTPSFATATATDNCSAFTLSFVDDMVTGICTNSYTVTRTWTATDACGNSSTASQTINVEDTTPPVIAGLPGTSTIGCTATPSFATATATDNCSTISLFFIDDNVAGLCPGSNSITRTWTAVDECGNFSTASQTINIQDNVGPIITCAGPVTMNTSCGTSTITLAQPISSDACSGVVSVVSNHPSNIYNLGVTSVVWTATDGCGNTSTCTQVVTVTSPEMDITGNSLNILDGSTTVNTTNFTDFGSAPICITTISKTYIIKNNGTGVLNLTGSPRVILSGPNAIDFTVTTQPVLSMLGPGQSTTFVVKFDPSVVGLRNATVSIINTDCDESLYDFAIRGNGRLCATPPPMIQQDTVVPVTQIDHNNTDNSAGSTTDIAAVETENEFNGRLYPNPSDGIFTLELNRMPIGKTEIRVMDALGQLIYTNEILNQSVYYDFSYLRAATYYISVISDEGVFTKTILITHKY